MHDLIKLSVVVFFFLSIVILLYLICVECNISFIASHIKLHFNSIMSVKKLVPNFISTCIQLTSVSLIGR